LFGARVIFGAERENIEVLAALNDQGCEVLCLVRHESWNDHIPAALASRGLAWRKVPYLDGRVPGWRLRTILRNPWAFLVANWSFLRIWGEFRPTHIHTFHPHYVLSFLPSLAVIPTPLVYRAGDIPIQHHWIWRWVWRFVIARAKRFVAVSNFIARELVMTGVHSEKIQVIYGLPPRRLNSPSAMITSERSRDIIFVGQIIEGKGPHLLVQAFRRLAGTHSEARLLIIGRISEWCGDDWARRLRASIEEDPVLSSRIIFLGFIDDVPSLLRGRVVLVAPSLIEEALGLVVMEAKEASIPSIVFPSGGLPELIEHGVDGLVCHDKSVDALADALRIYLENPSLSYRHGSAALRSLRRFGVFEFGRRWLAVYEDEDARQRMN
jgi:glycosyltransferase involved in cell wall biosynthesis